MRTLLLICAALTGFTACVPEEEGLELNYGKSIDLVIPTTVFIAIPAVLDAVTFEHGIDSVLSANDRSFSDVKRVELTNMRVVANDTTGAQIGFLSTMDLTFGVGDSTSVLVATSGDLAESDSTTFEMQTTTRDLSEYFAGDEFWMIPELVTDRTVNQPTTVSVEMDFLVETD